MLYEVSMLKKISHIQIPVRRYNSEKLQALMLANKEYGNDHR